MSNLASACISKDFSAYVLARTVICMYSPAEQYLVQASTKVSILLQTLMSHRFEVVVLLTPSIMDLVLNLQSVSFPCQSWFLMILYVYCHRHPNRPCTGWAEISAKLLDLFKNILFYDLIFFSHCQKVIKNVVNFISDIFTVHRDNSLETVFIGLASSP